MSTAYDLAKLGPLLEHHPIFPERANISLAQVLSREHIVLRTWERGAGLTRACGSAACAAAVAAARLQRTGPHGDGDAAGRRPADRMARARRPRADDRPGGVRIRGPFDPALFAKARCSVSVDVVTFGCRLNAYESEVIRRAGAGGSFADTVVFNTCAVTAEAVRQARQTIRKLKRERPAARIVVTGCAAQTEPQASRTCPRSPCVLGNEEKISATFWRAHRDVLSRAPFGIGPRKRSSSTTS